MLLEESAGAIEAAFEQAPEALPSHFTALARKAIDGSLGVLVFWRIHRFINPQPVSDRLDLPERNPGLSHSPRTGIHAQKKYLRGIDAASRHVFSVWLPSVLKRVVDM